MKKCTLSLLMVMSLTTLTLAGEGNKPPDVDLPAADLATSGFLDVTAAPFGADPTGPSYTGAASPKRPRRGDLRAAAS